MLPKTVSNFIRDFKISQNHRKRVSSIVLKTNEEIVRAFDDVKSKFLEFQRKEDKDLTIKYKSMVELFEWLINEQ